jgi:quercetin dioxygenase-like cupin family protein
MKLGQDEGKTINWHNTKMIFKTMLSQTDNIYSTILVTNPAGVGPALHLHPNGPETFFILEGDYTFTLSGKTIQASKGDFIFVPSGEPHKYKSGEKGGMMLVTTPPGVEKYFLHIADKILEGKVSLDYEFEFARKNGQVFLEKSGHYC